MTTWAQRQQPVVEPGDALLYDWAMSMNRRVSWWWGRRRVGDTTHVYCHICRRSLFPWGGGADLSPKAREALMEHRASHLATFYGAPRPEVSEQ